MTSLGFGLSKLFALVVDNFVDEGLQSRPKPRGAQLSQGCLYFTHRCGGRLLWIGARSSYLGVQQSTKGLGLQNRRLELAPL
jgi:hypothetical protein